MTFQNITSFFNFQWDKEQLLLPEIETQAAGCLQNIYHLFQHDPENLISFILKLTTSCIS